MSKGKRYTEEFKTEAVRQVVERGYSVDEVAGRLGISNKSLYKWRNDLHGVKPLRNQTDHQAEIVRLKAQLKRVEEECDILKRPPGTLQACPSKVRLYP